MLMLAISFLLGSIFLQSFSQLPTVLIFILCVVTAILLCVKYRKNMLTLSVAAFLLGCAYTGWRATQTFQWQLPHESEGKTLILRGIITSLPVKDAFGMHFIFKLSEDANIRLSWSRTDDLRVGDEYELPVRLKRIHGLQNPGGFDYEAWAMQSNLRATGSVITKLTYKLVRHHYLSAPVNQLRQMLQQRILTYLPNSPTSLWLLALMIGERSAAPAEHWQILRATGTNHLMAIAGLHIGLISGLVYGLVQFLCRRSQKLIAVYPAQFAASSATLITAWLYSMLAGFSIPTQRACLMLTFFLCALLLRRKLPAWHAWSASMLVMMLLDPLAVMSESFWLSFGTLALIAYGMNGRLYPRGWWWKWGRVQAVIGFGLLPLSLLFYQQTSLISVLANSIAIPWLGFFVLPLCLLSTIFLLFIPSVGGALLWLADKSLAGLWWMLTWFAHLDFAVWNAAIISPLVFITTLFACLLFLMPAGLPGRWLGIIWLLPLFLISSSTPNANAFWLTVLDVGQGLAVVVQTNHHTLLYDAGPKFGSQFDMGEAVVLPFLRASGIHQLDTLVISHGDNDHIGGAAAVLAEFPANIILTSAVTKFTKQTAYRCLAGQHWQWDGVTFEMLYPFKESLTLGNDSSCVLRISNQYHSVILTGDIEKFAENQLLLHSAKQLPSDIMTAPHHGSKTSSQRAFIYAVHPQYVIYAMGYRNRYHFPHLKVINEYSTADVLQLNTTESGAIQFQLGNHAADIKPTQYRVSHHRYWHD